MNRLILIRATILAGGAAVAACSSNDPAGSSGSGTAEFTTWGEELIEKGLEEKVFEDKWSFRYSKFLVVFRDIRVADEKGTAAATLATPKVFDMTQPGVKSIVKFPQLSAKPFPLVSYQIGPISADAEIGERATEADKQVLVTAGASVHVEGTAKKGDVTKTINWDFTAGTLYDRCEGERDGKVTKGIIVTNGGTDNVQLTIHGDHLFYDDLQAKNAKPRFNAIAAADANMDGKVTLDELAAVKLTSIPKENGGYGTGSAKAVNTLRDFVSALTQTIGHFRGEGECFARPVEKK